MVAAKSSFFSSSIDEAYRFPSLVSRRDGKLNFGSQVTFPDHREGWQGVLLALSDLHNSAGVDFDGVVENQFAWNRDKARVQGIVPYLNPWVGCLHNPPNIPSWFHPNGAPAAIFGTRDMQESLPYCAGLFVFSEYLRDHIAALVDVEVVALTHPTNLDAKEFSVEDYLANPAKKVCQVGSWLRRFVSLKHLDTHLPKRWLAGNRLSRYFESLEAASVDIENEFGELVVGDYDVIDRLNDDAYDELLSRNIVFLDLYDSSANNTVLECIARNTPLVVNRLPAVEEYLGPDYPLFYENLEEAGEICDDPSLVIAGHKYLKSMDKRRFSYDYFRQHFTDSSIYRSLPGVREVVRLGRSARAPVDDRESLNIVHGDSLSNDYVFVVSFRNCSETIVECLESIVRHHGRHDYGIVVIDDASSDDGLARAMAFLSASQVDHVAIANSERKYYTRNLYNAVHLVCTNDETVVVEVDGDDRLEDRDVIACIEPHYANGALKTMSRFRVEPGEESYPGIDFLEDSRLADVFDTADPWNLDVCFSWMHLKAFKRRLFRAVPLVYFLERGADKWLEAAEDLCVHPKMVELAPERTVFIDQVLYVYNFGGADHDVLQRDHAAYVTSKLFKMPKGSHLAALRAELMEEARVARKERRLKDAASDSGATRIAAGS